MRELLRCAVIFGVVILLIFPGRGLGEEGKGEDERVVPEAVVTPGDKAEGEEAKSVYKNLELFANVLEIVSKNYVKEADTQELIYGALKGMLTSLDSYSQFMEPDVYKEMQVETKGEFGGLGIEITIRDGVLTVVTPIEGTPASRVGLQPGDKIVKIEDESTKNITIFEAVKKLRGKPGTQVQITVLRPGEKELLEFTIARDIIHIDSVKDALMLNDRIGYIRLAQFQQNTTEEFDQALEELEEKGVKGLILDLRYNPGGLLSAAVEIADRFLKKGQVIVQTLGRDDRVEMEIKATSREEIAGVPLVILINKGSASGSEIVAGALRDNDRALLVGVKSFGKGSVQTVLPLRGEGSALRLTTGHYYTASKKMIQDEGIEPDIEVTMTDEEKKAFLKKKYRSLEEIEEETEAEKVKWEEIESKQEVKKAEEADEEEEEENGEEGGEVEELLRDDPQLQKALDIIEGILIFKQFQEKGRAES